MKTIEIDAIELAELLDRNRDLLQSEQWGLFLDPSDGRFGIYDPRDPCEGLIFIMSDDNDFDSNIMPAIGDEWSLDEAVDLMKLLFSPDDIETPINRGVKMQAWRLGRQAANDGKRFDESDYIEQNSVEVVWK